MVGAELFRLLRMVAPISTFEALHPNFFHELVRNLYNCSCAVCWVARVKITIREIVFPVTIVILAQNAWVE